jgi:hypothetical protein
VQPVTRLARPLEQWSPRRAARARRGPEPGRPARAHWHGPGARLARTGPAPAREGNVTGPVAVRPGSGRVAHPVEHVLVQARADVRRHAASTTRIQALGRAGRNMFVERK